MPKKKNQLFRTLAAMKPTEKAYFKKYAPMTDRERPLLSTLFELADKQAEGDPNEEEIASRFHQKHPRQNYTKAKSRLLELLLHSLREYDRHGNDTEKIFDYLATAESLKKRNLFHDALGVLQKAEKLALELEATELLILCQSKRYHFETYTQNYRQKFEGQETVGSILSEVDNLRDRIEADMAAYRILHFQKSIGVPRSPEDFELLSQIQAQPFFRDDYAPALGSSRLNLAVAKSGIFFSLGDTQAVIRTAEQLLSGYDVSDKLRRLQETKYLGLFDSLLQACLLSLDLPRFERHYAEFQLIEPAGEHDRHLKLGIDLYSRSIYAIVGRRLEALPGLREEFDRVKEEAFIPNYRKVSLLYYMVFGSFLTGHLDAAFAQIQWIKGRLELGLRYDIEVGIRGMECALLLEKEDFDLLEYRLRAFDDFLKKKDRKFKAEAAVLSFYRRALRVRDEADLMDACRQTRGELEEILAANPAEATFLSAFDVVAWLESKESGSSFAEAYYRRNIPQMT